MDTAEEKSNNLPLLDITTAQAYLNARKRAGLLVATGVFLCIMGAAFLILIGKMTTIIISNWNLTIDGGSSLGLVPLLVLVAVGVALFIYSGSITEKFEYLKKGYISGDDTDKWLQERYDHYNPRHTLAIMIAVILCIISPLALIVPAELLGGEYAYIGLFALLTMIAVAVFLFIYAGSGKDALKFLMRKEEYAPQEKESNKVLGVISAIVWPLAVCVFLIGGFVWNLWHIIWIVFPITGILFGMASAVVAAVKKSK